jgi:hypothetical protein
MSNQPDSFKTALLSDIQQSLEKTLDEAREIITIHLKHESDKCSDCQCVCLLNQLSSLEALVNGISV